MVGTNFGTADTDIPKLSIVRYNYSFHVRSIPLNRNEFIPTLHALIPFRRRKVKAVKVKRKSGKGLIPLVGFSTPVLASTIDNKYQVPIDYDSTNITPAFEYISNSTTGSVGETI